MDDHSTPTRICSICTQAKPMTAFAKVNRGYRSTCKPCFNAASRAEYDAAISANRTKCCTVCMQHLPITGFDRAPGGQGGAKSICRACARSKFLLYASANHEKLLARSRADYQENREKRIASVKRYSAANPEKVKQFRVDYYAQNREDLIAKQKARRDADIEDHKRREAESRARNIEKRRERFREWVAANPDKMRAAHRSWRDRNPEKYTEYEARRRALKNNAPVTEKIDRAAIIARDNSTCYLCERVLSRDEITLDHYIPLSAGGPHTAANLCVACRPCNSRKGARIPTS